MGVSGLINFHEILSIRVLNCETRLEDKFFRDEHGTYSFQINAQSRKLVLRAETRKDAKRWVAALRQYLKMWTDRTGVETLRELSKPNPAPVDARTSLMGRVESTWKKLERLESNSSSGLPEGMSTNALPYSSDVATEESKRVEESKSRSRVKVIAAEVNKSKRKGKGQLKVTVKPKKAQSRSQRRRASTEGTLIHRTSSEKGNEIKGQGPRKLRTSWSVDNVNDDDHDNDEEEDKALQEFLKNSRNKAKESGSSSSTRRRDHLQDNNIVDMDLEQQQTRAVHTRKQRTQSAQESQRRKQNPLFMNRQALESDSRRPRTAPNKARSASKLVVEEFDDDL